MDRYLDTRGKSGGRKEVHISGAWTEVLGPQGAERITVSFATLIQLPQYPLLSSVQLGDTRESNTALAAHSLLSHMYRPTTSRSFSIRIEIRLVLAFGLRAGLFARRLGKSESRTAGPSDGWSGLVPSETMNQSSTHPHLLFKPQ